MVGDVHATIPGQVDRVFHPLLPEPRVTTGRAGRNPEIDGRRIAEKRVGGHAIGPDRNRCAIVLPNLTGIRTLPIRVRANVSFHHLIVADDAILDLAAVAGDFDSADRFRKIADNRAVAQTAVSQHEDAARARIRPRREIVGDQAVLDDAVSIQADPRPLD